MKTDPEDVIEQVRIAYSDSSAQDSAGYSHNDRCLTFLTSGWLTPDEAKNAVGYIGPYNHFDPDAVREVLSDISSVDPNALVAVGREGSPVLYVETDSPEAVIKAFRNGTFGRHNPDELGPTSTVGNARAPFYDDRDVHNMCQHDEPPVPVDDFAEPDPGRSHVRAWWD